MDLNRMLAGLSREEKAIIYFIGAVDALKAKGLLEGGSYRLDEKGRRTYAAIVESGFTPTNCELDAVMKALQED